MHLELPMFHAHLIEGLAVEMLAFNHSGDHLANGIDDHSPLSLSKALAGHCSSLQAIADHLSPSSTFGWKFCHCYELSKSRLTRAHQFQTYGLFVHTLL
jgi:hypothetical protein